MAWHSSSYYWALQGLTAVQEMKYVVGVSVVVAEIEVEGLVAVGIGALESVPISCSWLCFLEGCLQLHLHRP
jgi:hypothetical protein